MNNPQPRCFEIEPHAPGGRRPATPAPRKEDGEEIEMGGGVFRPEPGSSSDDAYADALETGEDWLAESQE